ncbi:hypothetical protein HDZ31DRAFT_62924 [Schizophyllum fasciatum]
MLDTRKPRKRKQPVPITAEEPPFKVPARSPMTLPRLPHVPLRALDRSPEPEPTVSIRKASHSRSFSAHAPYVTTTLARSPPVVHIPAFEDDPHRYSFPRKPRAARISKLQHTTYEELDQATEPVPPLDPALNPELPCATADGGLDAFPAANFAAFTFSDPRMSHLPASSPPFYRDAASLHRLGDPMLHAGMPPRRRSLSSPEASRLPLSGYDGASFDDVEAWPPVAYPYANAPPHAAFSEAHWSPNFYEPNDDPRRRGVPSCDALWAPGMGQAGQPPIPQVSVCARTPVAHDSSGIHGATQYAPGNVGTGAQWSIAPQASHFSDSAWTPQAQGWQQGYAHQWQEGAIAHQPLGFEVQSSQSFTQQPYDVAQAHYNDAYHPAYDATHF